MNSSKHRQKAVRRASLFYAACREKGREVPYGDQPADGWYVRACGPGCTAKSMEKAILYLSFMEENWAFPWGKNRRKTAVTKTIPFRKTLSTDDTWLITEDADPIGAAAAPGGQTFLPFAWQSLVLYGIMNT